MNGSPEPTPVQFVVSHSSRSSNIGLVIWAVLFIALGSLPFWCDRSSMRLMTEVYSYLALASLWNLLAGYAGLVSVGQQAFVGLGGYALFSVALILQINPLWGIPAAGVIAGLMSIPIVLLLFRLKGAYFTIGSWVIAEIFPYIFAQVKQVGGGSGQSLPAHVVRTVAESRDAREFLIYWLFFGVAVAVLLAIVVLLRSRYGLALQAIRDNETAAKSNGIDVNRTKLVVFVVAAVCTGIVGALIFLQKLSITPWVAFSMNNWTVYVIFITVIGGIGRIEGPIVGTIIFFALRQYLADLATVYLIVFGVVAILVMLWAPRGLWGYFADRYGWQLFPLARRLERRST
jgi:branched-chain amino acid transport system permease protein